MEKERSRGTAVASDYGVSETNRINAICVVELYASRYV